MPEKTVLLCDAEDGHEGEWVEIGWGGKRWEVILCADHLEPLEMLAKMGRPARPSVRSAGPSRAAARRDSSKRRMQELLVREPPPGGSGSDGASGDGTGST